MAGVTTGAPGNAHGDHDNALTQLPAAARRLVAAIAADPQAPTLAAVTGCGGSGKTFLLALVANAYRNAGTPVTRPHSLADLDGSATDRVLLVDDAHALDENLLDRLRILAEAEAPNVRLVVAYRPWPRNPGLTNLVNVITRTRPQIGLGRWDAATIAARITRQRGTPPEAELVELVRQQTGGRPRLVDLLAAAMAEGERRGHPLTDAPADVLERVRHDIEGQRDNVRALLLARAIGADSDVDVLAPLLDTTPAAVLDAIEGALATGLTTDDGELLPLARQAILRGTPAARLHMHRQRLAAIHSDRGGSMLNVAQALRGTGATGAGVATVLSRAGDEALPESPALAARLYAEAVAAGSPPLGVAARRAEAHALTGDLDQALRFSDQVVADPAAPDRARAAIVAAAIVAHRGLLARSAELHRWGAGGPGAQPDEAAPLLSALAVPPLIGTGALAEARHLLAAAESAPAQGPYPTLLAGAATLMARGMYDSVAGSPTAALSGLTRAASLLEPAGPTVLLPDTPAALAALVALHCGELDVAASAVERALAVNLGGPVARTRHLLLQAWIAVIRGSLEPAAQLLAVAAPPGRTLEPRDELFAAALHVALARRHSDIAGLTRAWRRAREAIVRHPVDLYALQPLGELAVAAGRLGEQRWLEPHLAEAQELLSRLGNPPLWAAPLHWFAFHAAVTAEQPPQATRHAAALQETASASPYAARLAAAARCWLRVLTGNIDVAAVEAAARGLHAVGMSWDGSRLAGQAAIRVGDRAAMTALLSCARALQPPSNPGEPPVPSVPTASRTTNKDRTFSAGHTPPVGGKPAAPRPREATSTAATGGAGLSDREREVAALLLAGFTHKQIGERLFISPKTVEHHVSRMRQRFGSPTRGELFSHLRLMLEKR